MQKMGPGLASRPVTRRSTAPRKLARFSYGSGVQEPLRAPFSLWTVTPILRVRPTRLASGGSGITLNTRNSDVTNLLTFETHTLSVIDRDGSIWLSAGQLGEPLGLSDGGRSVIRIYSRHADEFTETMTCVVNLTTQGDVQDRQTRLFSLRGAWLIALLARTDQAKRFRVWVLDLIEAEARGEGAKVAALTRQLAHAKATILISRPRWQRIAHYHDRGLWTATIANLMGLSFGVVEAELALMHQAGVVGDSDATAQAARVFDQMEQKSQAVVRHV